MFKIGEEITKETYINAVRWCNKNNATIKKFNGRYVIVEVLEEKLTYSDLRQKEYPSITEQLDMIYWDSINGTSNWLDKISEIKNKYPKE